MKAEENVYKAFWQKQTTPLHRFNDEATYKAYALELKNIFEYYGHKGGKVLEIGCGNGALFPYFDFDAASYRGVDISRSLLDIFKAKYPNLDLVLADGSEYKMNEKYELIFGNAVHQHFNSKMLKQHLTEIQGAMSPSGIIVLANLPYRYFKLDYYCGELSGNNKMRTRFEKVISIFKYYLASFRRKFSGIGYWYSSYDITSMLGPDYEIKTLGSNFYPYRVHLVITKKNHEKPLS